MFTFQPDNLILLIKSEAAVESRHEMERIDRVVVPLGGVIIIPAKKHF